MGYLSREHGGQPLGDNELLLYLAQFSIYTHFNIIKTQILNKILNIFGYINIFRYFFVFLGLFQIEPEPNPTRNRTESEPINSNYPNGSNYLRSDPTRTRYDPNRPGTENMKLLYRILNSQTRKIQTQKNPIQTRPGDPNAQT